MSRRGPGLACCALAAGVAVTAALPAGIGGAATGAAVAAVVSGSQHLVGDGDRSLDTDDGDLTARGLDSCYVLVTR